MTTITHSSDLQVFEIKVKCRTGEENFVSCMRKALASCYGDKPVGMGGVFVISQGSAKLHVMVRRVHAETVHVIATLYIS